MTTSEIISWVEELRAKGFTNAEIEAMLDEIEILLNKNI